METKEIPSETGPQGRSDRQPKPEPAPDVKIIINKVVKKISVGRHTVVEIKKLGGVPLADELEQLIDGKLKPLPDDGVVTIKGGEIFMSHVRSGGSS